jgi:tRNA (adenine-N(1)-)-methyltransferase non-catalytic subunit
MKTKPLIECHSFLKKSQKATHMELSDSWLREYQVLPERTHPKVMMDCSGGYLLTGITVNNE